MTRWHCCYPVVDATGRYATGGLVVGVFALVAAGRWALPSALLVTAATYPPLTAAVRRAWNALIVPDGSHGALRGTAMAAETSWSNSCSCRPDPRRGP